MAGLANSHFSTTICSLPKSAQVYEQENTWVSTRARVTKPLRYFACSFLSSGRQSIFDDSLIHHACNCYF